MKGTNFILIICGIKTEARLSSYNCFRISAIVSVASASGLLSLIKYTARGLHY